VFSFISRATKYSFLINYINGSNISSMCFKIHLAFFSNYTPYVYITIIAIIAFSATYTRDSYYLYLVHKPPVSLLNVCIPVKFEPLHSRPSIKCIKKKCGVSKYSEITLSIFNIPYSNSIIIRATVYKTIF
jgi:hypothetical protein